MKKWPSTWLCNTFILVFVFRLNFSLVSNVWGWQTSGQVAPYCRPHKILFSLCWVTYWPIPSFLFETTSRVLVDLKEKKHFSFHIQLTATSACRLPWIVNGTQFNLIHFLILNFFPSFPPCLLATFLRYTNECWRLQLIQKAASIFQQPLTQQLVNVESWWLAFDKYEGVTLIGGNSRSSFPHLSSPTP